MRHKQELIDILMADAQLQNRYADKEGNTCAVGGISAAFGWVPRPLKRDNKMYINKLFLASNKHRMIVALKKAIAHFELTQEDLMCIQTVNDEFEDKEDRHNALRELIEGWQEE